MINQNNSITYRVGFILIATHQGKVNKKGLIVKGDKGLGVWWNGSEHSITHLATGKAICYCCNSKAKEMIATLLDTGINWNKTNPCDESQQKEIKNDF